MFLFIVFTLPSQSYHNCLNTSHVLIYLRVLNSIIVSDMKFKYISCSYLSADDWIWGGSVESLNTSHVLIYPNLPFDFDEDGECLNTSHVLIYLILDKNGSVAGRLFKYISCSYLSQIHSDFRTSILLFKYISCSYLSMYQNSCSSVRHRLNTSHVLIYRQRSWVLSAQYQV